MQSGATDEPAIGVVDHAGWSYEGPWGQNDHYILYMFANSTQNAVVSSRLSATFGFARVAGSPMLA